MHGDTVVVHSLLAKGVLCGCAGIPCGAPAPVQSVHAGRVQPVATCVSLEHTLAFTFTTPFLYAIPSLHLI